MVAEYIPPGGGAAFDVSNDRAPLNPQSAQWSVTIVNDCTGGTFTLSVAAGDGDPIVTGAVAHNATSEDLQAVLDAALGSGNTSVSGDDLPTGTLVIDFSTGTLAIEPITVDVGANDLIGDTPAPSLSQTQAGSAGDNATPGTAWLNTDDEAGWVNVGDGDTPHWIPLGNIVSGQTAGVAFPGGVSGKGFSADSVASEGGTGFLGDEYNVNGYEGSAGAAVIALSTDPTETPPSANYVPGTLLLQNPDDGGITPGAVWVKIGSAIDAWAKVATA